MSFRSLILALMLFTGVSTALSRHELFTAVLNEHVKDGFVDYPAIKNDKRFTAYLAILADTDPTAIAESNERLAFWINAYNAFTLKLIIDHWPVTSIRDINKRGAGPWQLRWIRIGATTYSLDEIEHEIIRKEFDEPRIHAALVCAAESCPPLRQEAYTGNRLEKQLEENMQRFLHDPSKNRYDQESNILYLSEVFNWFGSDFGKRHGSALQYVIKSLKLSPASEPAVKFLPYNWNLNTVSTHR